MSDSTQGSITRRRKGLRWLWVALILAVAGTALAYRDLLEAAVRRNPMAGSAQSVERGKALWKQDCEVCHGAQGRGDGLATATLPRKPKDLTRIAKPPVFPDGVVAYRIANGGDIMPAWKSALSERDIWDLVSFIRSQRREASR